LSRQHDSPRVRPDDPALAATVAALEEVAKEGRQQGYRRLAVLGTRYTMEGPVYPNKLAECGLEHRIPGTQQRERINQIIFDELVYAVFRPESLDYFISVIQSLKNEGCDAVVLGCTEIPLLVTVESSPLPILDSTRLLARAALHRAIGGAVTTVPHSTQTGTPAFRSPDDPITR
jgi:aspartate racemase